MSPENKALVERAIGVETFGSTGVAMRFDDLETLLQAARAEERGKGPTREELAEACWYRLNNDRHGGPWYLGAKPTDSHAMRDTFAFADAILALFQKDKRNEG